MKLRYIVFVFSLYFFLSSHAWENSEASSVESSSHTAIEIGENQLVLQADKVPLGKLLNEIRGEFFTEISGLENRKNELITFRAQGKTIESIFKKILKHLGENNYAFEFADDDLKRVTVLPGAKAETAAPETQEALDEEHDRFVSAVKVNSVIEGSQAEDLGLAEGDIIVRYDGLKVESSMGLIRLVGRKSNMEQVEMIVVREGAIIPFVLKGGLIGVRISTTKIPLDEFEHYN